MSDYDEADVDKNDFIDHYEEEDDEYNSDGDVQDEFEPDEKNLNSANPEDEKKKDFEGSNNYKNDWVQCFYCTKYHPKQMHLADTIYCGHCWGWLNADQIKLTEGKYTGPSTMDEIKNFLKLTYPLHSTSCTNNECVYNKITQYNNSNTLHRDFCIELGFIDPTTKKNQEQNTKTEYKIKKNKGYTRINYKSSSITI